MPGGNVKKKKKKVITKAAPLRRGLSIALRLG